MATFSSVQFDERGSGNGTFFPVHGKKGKVAILPVPGGDRVYLQILGYDAAPLDIPAEVTAAQIASLRGKVATSGTLAYAGGSITARLTEVADVIEVKKDTDTFFCTLKFLTG